MIVVSFNDDLLVWNFEHGNQSIFCVGNQAFVAAQKCLRRKPRPPEYYFKRTIPLTSEN